MPSPGEPGGSRTPPRTSAHRLPGSSSRRRTVSIRVRLPARPPLPDPTASFV